MSGVETIYVDLHRYTVKNALKKVQETIKRYERKRYMKHNHQICFIVGQGKHSKNHIPVLKNKVGKWLNNNGYKPLIYDDNPGRIYINLGQNNLERNRNKIDSTIETERNQSIYARSDNRHHVIQISPFEDEPLLHRFNLYQYGRTAKNRREYCCCFYSTLIILILLVAALLIWKLIFS